MKSSLCIAVLTGDVIDSTALSSKALEHVRETFMEAVGEIKTWRRGLVIGNAEFFRGDAWQLALSDPALALRASVYLRAELRAYSEADSRISIGIGHAKKINQKRISLSTGVAFELSGRRLDEMTVYSDLTISATPKSGTVADWLPVVAGLCDALIRQWTPRQSEIVSIACFPPDQRHEDIAAQLSPAAARQTVSRALDGAQWRAISDAIDQFERTNWVLFVNRANRSAV